MDWRKQPRPYRKKGKSALSKEMKICVTEAEYQRIGELATANKMSMSSLLRNCFLFAERLQAYRKGRE